jgi:hypothetical protein
MVDEVQMLGHVAKNNLRLRKAIDAMLTEVDRIITASEGSPAPNLLAINRHARLVQKSPSGQAKAARYRADPGHRARATERARERRRRIRAQQRAERVAVAPADEEDAS